MASYKQQKEEGGKGWDMDVTLLSDRIALSERNTGPHANMKMQSVQHGIQ